MFTGFEGRGNVKGIPSVIILMKGAGAVKALLSGF
jgi:hypothetical protein